MTRTLFVAVLISVVLTGCERSVDFEHPVAAPASAIALSFLADGAVNWEAALYLSEDRKLQSVELTCAGRLYATLPAVTEHDVVGASFSATDGGSCEADEVVLFVYVVPNLRSLDGGGEFESIAFYFESGRFVGRSDRP